MLSYGLLRDHAGVLLIGDYTSLTWLHSVVHDVNDRSPLVKDKEGAFLGLAYDVRKAYEQQREVIQPPQNFEEIGVRYGAKILWPVLLLQHRLLGSPSPSSVIPPRHKQSPMRLRPSWMKRSKKILDYWANAR